MAAEVSERTKKTLGKKYEICADFFVVDNKGKDQTNQGELIFKNRNQIIVCYCFSN